MHGVRRRTADPGAPVSVAGRLLSVLDAFTPARTALSLSELSAASGLAASTTHRLVGALVGWGALERDPDGRYRIGLRLWEVGSLAPRSLGLRESAMPFLEDLYEATRQHVQLAVRDGHEVVYVERISARGAVNIVTRPGSRLPVHATGVGLALLAHAPPDVQEEAIAGPLKSYTGRTITSGKQLRTVLAGVRRDGFVISIGQIELITQSIAAPIRGADDSVVAALSIVVPVEVDGHSLAPAVRAAARGISRALGAPRAVRPPD